MALCIVSTSVANEVAEQIIDVPLVFALETQQGKKSCLVAINHLALRPAAESESLVACAKEARALVFETKLTDAPPFRWADYERAPNELALSDLHEATVKRVRLALVAALYGEKQIDYFLSLHPIGIYRALIYSSALKADVQLVANLDLQLLSFAHRKGWKVLEMEGMKKYFQSERQLSRDQIETLISKMTDLLLSPQRLADYKQAANDYANDLSAQPNIDTAWEKKRRFNTVALGLPEFSVAHDVDDRNKGLTEGMLRAMDAEGTVLIFIGAAHIGGPKGVLKLLESRGIKITRLQ